MEIGDFLKDLSARLTDILPPALKTIKSDCEKNMHSVLVSAFSKLELVTREEFDTQTKVLARSRQKITDLEKKIQALEQQIQHLPNAK
jgi:BMFP domain-containing protein YqiC